tara:strand:+ start:1000 stop:1236 length:237 start_codon:yes stop_codon:yes gene_type:complete
MEKTFNYKFRVERLLEENNELEIKMYRYTHQITKEYGIPRPSIYKIISGDMDYVHGKWSGFMINHINEPAFKKLSQNV